MLASNENSEAAGVDAKSIPVKEEEQQAAATEEVKVEEGAATATATATAPPAVEAEAVSATENEEAVPTATEAPAEEATKPLPGWEKYPVKYDGWVVSHNAIRLDLDDLVRIVEETIPAHIAAGKMQPWMGDNLMEWYEHICNIIHEHHDHEEEIFFPAMNERVTVPEKLTADHKTLMSLMGRTKEEIKALSAAIKENRPGEELEPLRATLSATARAFNAEMRAHLQEEEEIGLPLFRANFTKKEASALEAKITKTIKPIFLGNLLRPLDEADRRMWMKKYAKIPAPVITFILWPKVKDNGAYYQTYTRVYDEIVKAERIPVKSAGKCVVM
ncbi:Hypothetical Protein FCC1311_042452 [Hondaea fermentalgiana]|uniref:Hemerythrin-like domain-containing protein n=1 Tax=Hondaea fermentalgiana TaxID=2315210 RepID=A0A2R5GAI7_9STRA|nr:Hypothetical Protein FCC1311_042452 [Hondaea fermentalgiana]|eukprot:GBG28022.1 Hypothetical Protein FCC1311_042452 [Hondaea fermentalgiana]